MPLPRVKSGTIKICSNPHSNSKLEIAHLVGGKINMSSLLSAECKPRQKCITTISNTSATDSMMFCLENIS